MPTTIEQPSEDSIKQEALTISVKASLVRIVDQGSYEEACSLLLDQIKPFRKRWAEYWEQPKTMAYQAYKSILGKFQDGDEPLAKAEAQVKGAISAWDQEQERKRKAEEDARKAEEERRQREVAVAEDFGATEEEIEAIVSAPVTVVAAPVAPTYQKASGVSSRENWKARVIDIKKLCLAVAKGQVPANYISANETALNARAKADKRTLNVPGVVAYNDPIVSGRTR
jgi:hypothetical protein